MATEELKTASGLKKKVSEVHAFDQSGAVFKVSFLFIVNNIIWI